jgi:hypothetical protein
MEKGRNTLIKINVHSYYSLMVLIMVSCMFFLSPSMLELHSISQSWVVSMSIRCLGRGMTFRGKWGRSQKVAIGQWSTVPSSSERM